MSRVSSLVDNDTGALIKTLERHSKLLERPHRTEDQSTPPTPSVNEPRSNPNAIPVRQAYKNFQIMSGEYSSSPKRISDHYEMAPNIPVKEIVTPILTTPTQSHDQPPAVPPKALPPPIPPKLIIPPKSKHDNANHLRYENSKCMQLATYYTILYCIVLLVLLQFVRSWFND